MTNEMDIEASQVLGSNRPEAGPVSHEKAANKSLKRKRVFFEGWISSEEKKNLLFNFQREVESLYAYFKETLHKKVSFEKGPECSSFSSNSVVACLLEESSLPFSKLVEEIYEKLKTEEGITMASVRSSVLFVGQRALYGVANADADVLEDDSETCLWCWETRDLKLLPKLQRGVLSIRRTCRKKIHERITALSAMVSALSLPEAPGGNVADLIKTSEKLGKTINEVQIRLLIDNLMQKNGVELIAIEAKLKEKVIIKELERNKREAEKEKKRMERELQKEKLLSEKEQKRLQDETEKEERRREKEDVELKRQLKRQQVEAEKDQRQREKEEAKLKQQLAIQKQATIMERFVLRQKPNTSTEDNQSSRKASILDISMRNCENENAVTSSMDSALSQKGDVDTCNLLKFHMDTWQKFGKSICCSKSQHWGIRHKPKASLVKELRLQGCLTEAESYGKAPTPNFGARSLKLLDGWEETNGEDNSSCSNNIESPLVTMRMCSRHKKLLQFDKSHRPAYYGTLYRKSDFVGPRRPLRKDPDLDYDVDSDEEWEEEEPGESLSDCDKDDDEEILDEGNIKCEDDDGSEDSFMVPDGYLSEDEGAQVDILGHGSRDDEVRSVPNSCDKEVDNEEFKALLRSQKYLTNVTESALRKNQPMIISNLMHEKSAFIMVEELAGICKLERICLQALSVLPCNEGACVEKMTNHGDIVAHEDQEVSHLQSKSTPPPPVSGAVLSDSDLCKIVSLIQAFPSGINKMVQSLQPNFPGVSKIQLRSKVREIAYFADNRWQVKKDTLNRLGLSASPAGDSKQKGIISKFFTKRCMPSSCETVNTSESSPTCHKLKSKIIYLDDDNAEHVANQPL